MPARVAIIYNEPGPSRYDAFGEEKAVLGVFEAVEAVHQALLELGYAVDRIALAPPLGRARRKLRSLRADLVFNLFEGFTGYPETEALVPDILEEYGLPYTGCSGAALRLAVDKARLKVMLAAAGVPTPDFQILNPETLSIFRLKYPVIVKPRCEDASHGLSGESVVSDSAALARQVTRVSHGYGGDALVEEFVSGREFNATVLGDAEYPLLPVSEIAYALPAGLPEILTSAAKWEPGSLYFQSTRVICPADLEAEELKEIAGTARTAFRTLSSKGYARVDMRMNEQGELNVIEVNPNPDISPGTGATRQAAAAGMTYTQFTEKILALERKNNENQYPSDDSPRQTRHNANTLDHARI